MPANLEAMLTSKEMRYADHVDYSIRMISAIAVQYNDALDQGDFLKASSMVDAFYVHVRLMTEFLVKPTNAQDFGPADFEVHWTIPAIPESGRLIEYWKTASKYVVHFGGLRVPENLDTLKPFQVDNVFFKAVAVDVLVVFAAFIRALRPQASSWKDGARVPDRDREPDQWRARLLADRFGRLRKVFLDACQEAGLDAAKLLNDASK